MQSREQVAEELSRLQRDNDSLKGKHRLHSELQLQESFSMPATVHVRATPPPITPTHPPPPPTHHLSSRLLLLHICTF